MTKFTFADLFAGIGGIRFGFEHAGAKHVWSNDYDKYCKQTYESNFGPENYTLKDIKETESKEIPDFDILCGGFPCQPFSNAGVAKKNSLGRQHGFMDKTQGTLFFDIARIIKEKKPKAFFLENVKSLVGHDKGKTFPIIRETLESLGYSFYYKVIDGALLVPQHRERTYMVGFSDRNIDFQFPEIKDTKPILRNILEKKVDKKYTLSDKLWNYLQEYAKKHKELGHGFGYGLADPNGISRTLSARYYKDGAEILIPQPNKNPRRLVPRECARLQGFPEDFIIPVSDNQSYKQFGNSVAVPVIKILASTLIKTLEQQPQRQQPYTIQTKLTEI